MKRNVAKGRKQFARLEDIPNIGPSIAADLRQLGITTPAELPGRDPYALYDELCRTTGQRQDICNKGWTHFLAVSLKQFLETGAGQPYRL
jgi:hypothetical protein